MWEEIKQVSKIRLMTKMRKILGLAMEPPASQVTATNPHLVMRLKMIPQKLMRSKLIVQMMVRRGLQRGMVTGNL